jgi:hypothetical protein
LGEGKAGTDDVDPVSRRKLEDRGRAEGRAAPVLGQSGRGKDDEKNGEEEGEAPAHDEASL